MNLEQALYTRRATREFTSEAVDRSMLLRLIDAAIQGPSAVNEQPWSFTVPHLTALLSVAAAQGKGRCAHSTVITGWYSGVTPHAFCKHWTSGSPISPLASWAVSLYTGRDSTQLPIMYQ
jgi:nitroreductase